MRVPSTSESWLTSNLSMMRTSVLLDCKVAIAMSRSKPSPCAALAGSMVIGRIVPPDQASNAAGAPPRPSAGARLADHYGNITLRPVLVPAVSFVGGHNLGPERRLLLGRGGAGPERTGDPGNRSEERPAGK